MKTNAIEREIEAERKALAEAQIAGSGYLCVLIQANIDRLFALA